MSRLLAAFPPVLAAHKPSRELVYVAYARVRERWQPRGPGCAESMHHVSTRCQPVHSYEPTGQGDSVVTWCSARDHGELALRIHNMPSARSWVQRLESTGGSDIVRCGVKHTFSYCSEASRTSEQPEARCQLGRAAREGTIGRYHSRHAFRHGFGRIPDRFAFV